MQKILFIALFSIFISVNSFGQSIDKIKSFADQLYLENNFNHAYKEYQRVFFFDKDNKFTDIHHKIATILYIKEDYNEAVKYYNLAWNATENDSLKNELVFNKVLCDLKSRKYYAGLNELYDLPETDSDYFKKKQILFEAICQFGLDDYKTSNQLFQQLVDTTGRKEISETFVELTKYNKKYNPKRIELMSRILPGLGQMYLGEWKNGINSILLLGAIVYYSGVTMVNYGFIDGVLVVNSWFLRYYSGGAENGKHLAEEHIRNKKSEIFLILLNIIEQNELK